MLVAVSAARAATDGRSRGDTLGMVNVCRVSAVLCSAEQTTTDDADDDFALSQSLVNSRDKVPRADRVALVTGHRMVQKINHTKCLVLN